MDDDTLLLLLAAGAAIIILTPAGDNIKKAFQNVGSTAGNVTGLLSDATGGIAKITEVGKNTIEITNPALFGFKPAINWFNNLVGIKNYPIQNIFY
jgi:hypothetical protein